MLKSVPFKRIMYDNQKVEIYIPWQKIHIFNNFYGVRLRETFALKFREKNVNNA